jgi:hypothetical protein
MHNISSSFTSYSQKKKKKVEAEAEASFPLDFVEQFSSSSFVFSIDDVVLIDFIFHIILLLLLLFR